MSMTFPTPEFTVQFPEVFTLNKDGKFSVIMLFDKDQAFNDWVAGLAAAQQEAINYGLSKVWGGQPPASTMLPIRDTLQPSPQGKIPATDWGFGDKWQITATAQAAYPPGVYDAQLQKMVDPNRLWGGCICEAELHLFPWANDRGGKGLGFGLNCLVLRKEGERSGGTVVTTPQHLKASPVVAGTPAAAPQMPAPAPAPAQPAAQPQVAPQNAYDPGTPAPSQQPVTPPAWQNQA